MNTSGQFSLPQYSSHHESHLSTISLLSTIIQGIQGCCRTRQCATHVIVWWHAFIPSFVCYRCCSHRNTRHFVRAMIVGTSLGPNPKNFGPRLEHDLSLSAPRLHPCLPAVSKLSRRCQPRQTSWISSYPRPSGKHPQCVQCDSSCRVPQPTRTVGHPQKLQDQSDSQLLHAQG